MISYWTKLQYPLQMAAYVENGTAKVHIPDHPPRTPVRHVGVVGELGDELVVLRHASFQIWDRAATHCSWDAYHPLIYAPHAAVEYDGKILVCASGLDLFFLMDRRGKVVWEWWGHENGCGGKNPWYFGDNWQTHHVSGRDLPISKKESAHFNSIWLDGDGSFLTSALKKKKIIRIRPGEQGFEPVLENIGHGAHSPIMESRRLIYCLKDGLVCDGENVGPRLRWPKYIRAIHTEQKKQRAPLKVGPYPIFVVTHEDGVSFLDHHFDEIMRDNLPRPFQLTFLNLEMK